MLRMSWFDGNSLRLNNHLEISFKQKAEPPAPLLLWYTTKMYQKKPFKLCQKKLIFLVVVIIFCLTGFLQKNVHFVWHS